ncbi:glycosyltransferase family 4 protein [Limnohabitans sp. WS1]|uniref:glycosyltransferase family 4 protein n=1 Tax=Limnohabitans sp. WS1 TaxID=1100726 RepID=UPI0013048E96|nr:glycosyltransferase [Limnohabitans sp. WS1]
MSQQMSNIMIALVVPSLEQGGGVPSVAEFVCKVAERSKRFDVRLISLSTSMVDDVGLAITRPRSWLRGVEVAHGTWRGRPITRIGVFASELEFQRYKPRPELATALAGCDLIQVVCGSPAWANSVVGLGKPVSLQVATRVKVERRRRDANPKTLAGWWRKCMTIITDQLDDRALHAVDAIQLENPWMLDYCRQINQGRADVDVRYAPPGVDVRLFCPLEERHTSAAPYILCVGRLDDPRKNISLLLNAFSQLPASLSHVHLVTAGAGKPPPDYWVQVASKGLKDRVRHIQRPKTIDLVKLYQQATAFALSSDEEGLGVVILEAMACGVPVVATRCGGPDGIITDGKDGFLVPLDDAAAMADRLALLCTDAAMNQQMGREARATIEAHYADDVAGAAFVDVWDKLLQMAGKR